MESQRREERVYFDGTGENSRKNRTASRFKGT